MEIFTDVSNGYLNILTNGGNGKKGQNGQDGKPGVDRVGKVSIRTKILCEKKYFSPLIGVQPYWLL